MKNISEIKFTAFGLFMSAAMAVVATIFSTNIAEMLIGAIGAIGVIIVGV